MSAERDANPSVAASMLAVALLLVVAGAAWHLLRLAQGDVRAADDAPSCCEVPVEVVLDGDVLIGCRGEERFAGCGPLKAGDRVHLDGECRVEPGAMSAGLRLLQGLRLDLNRASEGDLELLDGVGPSLAQAIVEYRGEHGPFRAVDDLEKVNGIGPKTLAALRPYLDVAP